MKGIISNIPDVIKAPLFVVAVVWLVYCIMTLGGIRFVEDVFFTHGFWMSKTSWFLIFAPFWGLVIYYVKKRML